MNNIFIIGSEGSVGKGIADYFRSQGCSIIPYDKQKGDYIEKLTYKEFVQLAGKSRETIYCAESGNRDEYEKNPTLYKRNIKVFEHFCSLVHSLKHDMKIRYIGGSWTKRNIPANLVVEDTTPNKSHNDKPNAYEIAKIKAEENSYKLAIKYNLDITFCDWISIVPNYAENFSINTMMKELLSIGVVRYTPGDYGRPLLAAHDAARALFLYMKDDNKVQKGKCRTILIPGLFTPFELFARTVFDTAMEMSRDKAFKKRARMEKRTDKPPDFLKTRIESKLFNSLGFKPDNSALRKALKINAEYAFKLYTK